MIGLAVALALTLIAPREVTFVFGGDVALGRVVVGPAGPDVQPIGGTDPLGAVAEVLRGADLAVVNLEGALVDGPVAAGPRDGVRLVARPPAARALAAAGIDLVSTANNHALDAGVPGVDATHAALAQVGVASVGTRERTWTRVVGGTRVTFVAATDRVNATTPRAELVHVAWRPSARLRTELPEAVARLHAAAPADVIVVLVHWGIELSPGPTRPQRELARRLVDAGATLVVGHGPHVVHTVERHGDGLIAYSLGNLLFDMRPAATRTGALLRVRLAGRHIVATELLPTAAGP